MNFKYFFPHLIQKIPIDIALKNYCPIFMLHRIKNYNSLYTGHDPEHLHWCLNYLLSQGYKAISLEQLLIRKMEGLPIKRKTVVFTIDDGFSDNIVEAGEIFTKYKIPLTCFVISGFVAEKIWPWDDQISLFCDLVPEGHHRISLPDNTVLDLEIEKGTISRNRASKALRENLKGQSQNRLYIWLKNVFTQMNLDYLDTPPKPYRPASIEEMENFIQNGHSICPHTYSHRILSRLSDEEAWEEIASSQQWLKQNLSNITPIFAYPTGRLVDFTERDRIFLKQLGFMGAVTTDPRMHLAGDDLYALPRFGLPNNRFHFIQYLSFIEMIKHKIRNFF